MTFPSAGALCAAMLFFAGASSVLADPTPSAPAAASDQATQTVAKNDPNKLICKSEETTGTRLGAKRVCHTRADWDEMSRITEKQVGDAQAQGYQNTPNIH